MTAPGKPALQVDSITNKGWAIRTVKGPIMGDAETEEYRHTLQDVLVLPEMVYSHNVVEFVHNATGCKFSFNALDALKGWCDENLPPLQVKVAEEWRRAREAEIQQQQAKQLAYDWTFTTPYTCTVSCGHERTAHFVRGDGTASSAAGSSPDAANGAGAASTPPGTRKEQAPCSDPDHAANGCSSHGSSNGPAEHQPPLQQQQPQQPLLWEATSDQIDRGLLMERDPIMFYDEVVLYESDLDDNGVCQVTVKLRVMPKCWLALLRVWVRVDGSSVRLREGRMFCRHDRPDRDREVLLEVKHVEGTFAELRRQGAPGEGPPYADADAASQVFQAVAPVGVKVHKMFKLRLP